MFLEYRRKQQENPSEMSIEQLVQRECDAFNEATGSLTGYDCPICKNKGAIFHADGMYTVSTECSCMAIRRTMNNIRRSGLEESMKTHRLDNFETKTPLQRKMKEVALGFLRDHERQWMYFGGQAGCGKTHLCTAVVGEFLRQGIEARYMLWQTESPRLKSAINDGEHYDALLLPFCTVPVLYIDDLLRPTLDDYGHKKQPSTGDLNLAFRIINDRYRNPSLITVISSEWTMDDLQRIDPGVGSRIYQRSKGNFLSISTDDRKNYRLVGEESL